MYYLQRQIQNPICDILKLLIETPENLFYGAIEQENENRISRIRQYENKKKGQNDLSSFLKIKEKKETPIKLEIEDKIKLVNKDKIIEQVSQEKKETKSNSLDNWFIRK